MPHRWPSDEKWEEARRHRGRIIRDLRQAERILKDGGKDLPAERLILENLAAWVHELIERVKNGPR